MLSVLVCSVNPVFLEQLQENVKQTIGVNYELLWYDNAKENKGLCEVYNQLASTAAYDHLCFVHEDVLFTTQNWGKILLDAFSQNRAIGVIGVAGSKYKSAVFSGWFTGQKKFDCAHIIHRYNDSEHRIYLHPGGQSLLEEVVCLDGVFICCKKEIWNTVKFDAIHLKGFHLYDIDFSLRAAKICSVAVSFQIDMVHITKGGDFTSKWMETAMEYHLQHQKNLPFTKLQVNSDTIELQIAGVTLDVLKSYSISWNNKIRWIQLQQLHRHASLFYPILKFLLYQPLHLKHLHNLFKKL